MALTDYLILNISGASILFVIILAWSRLTTVRPLPPQKHHQYQTRTIIQQRNLQSNYYTAYNVYLWSSCATLPLLLLVQHTDGLYASSQTCITEYYWLYLLLIACLLNCAWVIYSTRAALERIGSDAMIALLIIFVCIQLYYLPANIWTITVLLECQGMALLLLLNTDQIIPKNTMHVTATALKQAANTTTANATLMQFWVGFIGAALLLVAGSLYISTTGATHWQDLVHLTVLHQAQQPMNKWAITTAALLVLSLLLKTGAFPLHFWKPELYNLLKFSNVFIYAVPYSVAVTFIVILLLMLLMFSVPTATKWLIWLIVLIATYILAPLLFALTEIKAFLAYTSGLHVLYMYTAVLTDRWIASASTFYNLSYGLATLTMFTALLNFRRTSIKYVTDFQIYSHVPTNIVWVGTALATMAGVPPLLGFWAKFNVLFSLWATGDFVLTIHLLTVSMIYMYFYLALYRFTGATNFKPHPIRLLQLPTTPIATIGLLTAALNSTGVWNMTDLSNWSALFAQQLYAYA